MIEDILPLVLNTKRPVSNIWLTRYTQNVFGSSKIAKYTILALTYLHYSQTNFQITSSHSLCTLKSNVSTTQSDVDYLSNYSTPLDIFRSCIFCRHCTLTTHGPKHIIITTRPFQTFTFNHCHNADQCPRHLCTSSRHA